MKNNNSINTDGLFVRIPAGYKIVVEKLNGDLRVKNSGLRFFYPWDKKYIYYIYDMPLDFPKENYKSIDGYEIIVDTAVTYHIPAEKLLVYHRQKNGEKQLKLTISEILRTYISNHSFEEITNWTFDLNNPDSVQEQHIIDKLSSFREKYGISVSNIIIEKAELTASLKSSREEDELTKAKNKRMIDTASAELTAAELRAKTQMIQGKTEADILASQLAALIKKAGKISDADKVKLIRDFIVRERANYTVIDSYDKNMTQIGMIANAINGNNEQIKAEQKVKK